MAGLSTFSESHLSIPAFPLVLAKDYKTLYVISHLILHHESFLEISIRFLELTREWEATYPTTLCYDFANKIAENDLHEVETKRAHFTWTRRSLRGYMECKQDRVLCNLEWIEFWEQTGCFTLPRHSSDHNPLVLHISEHVHKGPRPFIFMRMWTDHEDFKTFIEEKWKSYNPSGCSMFVLTSQL